MYFTKTTLLNLTLFFSNSAAQNTTTTGTDAVPADTPPQNPCKGCLAGNFMWVTPPPYTNPNPFKVGDTITLKWKYSNTVQVLPETITIQIKTRDGNWVDVVKKLNGYATEYDWIPQKFSTYAEYRLIIFNTARGREGTPLAGEAQSAISPKFGLYNPGEGGNGDFVPNDALKVGYEKMVLGMIFAFINYYFI